MLKNLDEYMTCFYCQDSLSLLRSSNSVESWVHPENSTCLASQWIVWMRKPAAVRMRQDNFDVSGPWWSFKGRAGRQDNFIPLVREEFLADLRWRPDTIRTPFQKVSYLIPEWASPEKRILGNTLKMGLPKTNLEWTEAPHFNLTTFLIMDQVVVLWVDSSVLIEQATP